MDEPLDALWSVEPLSAPLFVYPDRDADLRTIVVTDTLEAACWFTRSERVAWERSWIEYFESARAFELRSIQFLPSVRQPVLDAMRALRQLERLSVENGTYSDLEPLRALSHLRSLSLDCRNVRDIAPLLAMESLHSLSLYGAGRVENIELLGQIESLRTLDFDWLPGSKLQVAPTSFDWTQSMRSLERLHMPGARIEADLTPLAALPNLRELVIPLRRAYRGQVESLAETHQAFADLARDYAAYDQYVAETGES